LAIEPARRFVRPHLATEAIRSFNIFVHEDQRVEMVLLPIGDGLTLARKII
jgi:predicted O-methyltransferase YrrM